MINNHIIYKFFKDFTNHRKKTNNAVVFSSRPFPTFLNTGTINETFQPSGKQDYFRYIVNSSDSMYKSSDSQFFTNITGIKSRPKNLMNQGCYVLFNQFGSYRNIIQFKISYRRETGKEILDSWRLEFFKKFLTNNFALSGAEDNTSGLLNRGGMADLPSLRTLLAICQKSREPIFWEVIDSFVLVAYSSLTVSKILLQELLACLNFTLNSQDLFCWYK